MFLPHLLKLIDEVFITDKNCLLPAWVACAEKHPATTVMRAFQNFRFLQIRRETSHYSIHASISSFVREQYPINARLSSCVKPHAVM